MPDLTARIPIALKEHACWVRLGAAEEIPAMLVHPTPDHTTPAPVVIWLHGRTAEKELDPGRYLRLARAGIATCAIDLPGHGERAEASMQRSESAWEVLTTALHELNEVEQAMKDEGAVDHERMAIGGMSLGGMVALARLTKPHHYRCASVEATTGVWRPSNGSLHFTNVDDETVRSLEPARHLEGWRPLPLQVFHARRDAWVDFEGQRRFVEAIRAHVDDPGLVDFIVYEHTGAPHEHIGFGRMTSDAKARQTAFFGAHLIDVAQAAPDQASGGPS